MDYGLPENRHSWIHGENGTERTFGSGNMTGSARYSTISGIWEGVKQVRDNEDGRLYQLCLETMIWDLGLRFRYLCGIGSRHTLGRETESMSSVTIPLSR